MAYPKDPWLDPDMEAKNLIGFPDEDDPGTNVLQSIQEMWGPTPYDEEANRQEEKQQGR
ncbi:hypothetical protein [Desmospora profundinema]|uniref:Uncharacterized protein n=1 Tax=Desmospora profundinema TaxID=1571184 RepID=A0ABU1IKL9_9BACL|nr:hypothetical protein [Desmospora profundinema]MDR6225231.1 hypothetical protein [Desmospora profundinema]